jgi:uncharacterized damage-inducible protein DinB
LARRAVIAAVGCIVDHAAMSAAVISPLREHLRILACGNRMANRRLHLACIQLSDAEFRRERVSFFPSLWATLNHILIVDWFYIAALYREADMRRAWASETPCGDMHTLAAAQQASDERLIAWVDAADDVALDQEIAMDRGTYMQRDRARHVLMHLFTHQIHHRGQAHAMLAGTAVAPPQLDEFMMPSEAHFRREDMAALGWRDDEIYPR